MKGKRASRDELIAYLYTLPVDVVLETVEAYTHGFDQCVGTTDLILEGDNSNVEFIDLRGNPHTKPDSASYNKCFLKFGTT
jgi:hypothetical protein